MDRFKITERTFSILGEIDESVRAPFGPVDIRLTGERLLYWDYDQPLYLDPVCGALEALLAHARLNLIEDLKLIQPATIKDMALELRPLSLDECLDGGTYYVLADATSIVVVVDEWLAWGRPPNWRRPDSLEQSRRILTCEKHDAEKAVSQFRDLIQRDIEARWQQPLADGN